MATELPNIAKMKQHLAQLVDQGCEVSAKIKKIQDELLKPLEESFIAIKNNLDRTMRQEKFNIIEGEKGKAKFVETKRTSLDESALLKALGWDITKLVPFKVSKTSTYIKITPNENAKK